MKKNLVNGLIIICVMVMFGISANAQSVSGYKSVATIDKRFINYAPPSKTSAIGNCTGNQLALKEVESEGEMGGKVHGKYVFTNISSIPCTVKGFPVFILLDKSGKVMSSVKIKYDTDKPSLVRIDPKQTAWFQIFYSTGFGYDLKKTPPSSAKVKITVPKINRVFTLKSEIGAYRQLHVYAIKGGLPD